MHRLIGTGEALPETGTKLPHPAIVFDPGVPGAMPFAAPNAGLELNWPELLTVPVVMLYGVPAEKMTIGLTVIAWGRFRPPNRKNR